jgi:hypothetical protein
VGAGAEKGSVAGTSAFSGQVHSPYLLMDAKRPSGARGVVLGITCVVCDVYLSEPDTV